MNELILFGLKVKIVDDTPNLSNCSKCCFKSLPICNRFAPHPCNDINTIPSHRHFEKIK